MSWFSALLGRLFSGGVAIEQMGGLNFTGGLRASANAGTGLVDVTLSAGGDPTDAAEFEVVIESNGTHAVDNDVDYGGLPIARTVLEVRVNQTGGSYSVIFPAAPAEGQTIRVTKASDNVFTVSADPNGQLIQYRSRGTRGTSPVVVLSNSATQRSAAWRYIGGAWLALDHGAQDGWLDASDVTVSSNAVVANNTGVLGTATNLIVGEDQIIRRLAGEDLTVGKVTDALSSLTPAGLSGAANTVAVRAAGTTGAMSALAVGEDQIVRRLTGGNITAGKVTDALSSLTPNGITLDANSVLCNQSGLSGAGSSTALSEGHVLRRKAGANITSGKVLDELCDFRSPDDKLVLDQVAASSQLTGTITTGNDADLAGPTNIANGEYVRIAWTVLLTISGVDYVADYVASYQRASGTLTVIQEHAVFSAPVSVTITAAISGANQPELNIANATGSDLTYYVHHSTARQVK